MRRPLGKPVHSRPPARLHGKRLSHALVLVIAIAAAVYGTVSSSAPSTALSPATSPAGPGGTTTAVQRISEPPQKPEIAVSRPASGPKDADDEDEDEDAGGAAESTAESKTPESKTPIAEDSDEPSSGSEALASESEGEDDQGRFQSLGITPVATPRSTGAPRPGGTPAPSPTPSRPSCEASDSPAYCIYTVTEGDSLSSLAQKFGLESKDLLGWELLVESNKPELTNVNDFLQPGQKLRIPTRYGLVHTVVFAETVGDLADMFDVTSASIIQANNLDNADLLAIGRVLLIPNPKKIPEPPAAATDPEPQASEPQPESQPEPEKTREPEPEPPPSRPQSSAGFIWPITASANITSYFGPRHPLGIDLGLAHAPRSSIVAVADGKVVFAGGDACCSYGLYVIIQHDNGLQTLYGHLSRIDVRTGQRVSQGDMLGPSGSTGYSTGFHLHFEVSKDGARLNPLNFLPPR